MAISLPLKQQRVLTIYYSELQKSEKILSILNILNNLLHKLIKNKFYEGTDELINETISIFENAYKNPVQENFLPLLNIIKENKSQYSESFIRISTNISKLIERIESNKTS